MKNPHDLFGRKATSNSKRRVQKEGAKGGRKKEGAKRGRKRRAQKEGAKGGCKRRVQKEGAKERGVSETEKRRVGDERGKKSG